jgi:hypothetical protein
MPKPQLKIRTRLITGESVEMTIQINEGPKYPTPNEPDEIREPSFDEVHQVIKLLKMGIYEVLS